MKSVLDELERRGLVEATTGPELGAACRQSVGVYIGFDPTADSLHLGNLLGIVCLAWFQRFGHRPVALVGGATGMVGDPGGKSKERPLLSSQDLERNLQGIRRDLVSVLDRQQIHEHPVSVLNNYDWLGNLGLLEFLREIGRMCRMGPMLGKEMVRTRLESEEGLSYTEFSYQLLQAYDFLHLYDHHHITLQIGGSDQWGNIVAGTELVRKLRGSAVHGLTFPLLTRSDGKKFGKSEEGAIWLSASRLSPYELYQYLVRVPDADVIRLLRMLTFLPMEEVHEWQHRMQDADYEVNSAQRRLAQVITEMIHGEEAVVTALRVTQALDPGGHEAVLSLQVLKSLKLQMPSIQLQSAQFIGNQLVDVLVLAGLALSKSEGRRLISGGGVSLNNVKVSEINKVLQKEDLVEGQLALLSVGKKRKVLVEIQE